MIDRQSMLGLRQESVSDSGENGRSMRRAVGIFLMHVFLAMVGSWMVGTFALLCLLAPVEPVHRNLRLYELLAGPFSPAFLVSGLLLGLLVNNHTGSRSACRVWGVGLSWALIAILGSVPQRLPAHGEQRCTMWKAAKSSLLNRESPECGNLSDVSLLGEAPATSSIGYSLGAWLVVRAKQHEDAADA